ncbi:MAG: SMC-Scp complex subunit ScpB [Gammaproteobacteria bacterium]|nr:SMC-Scp complex subunit ScpB [Gammaproteobacteria bacterium]
MDDTEIKYFIESALLAAGRPLSIDQLQKLFDEGAEPEKSQIRRAIGTLLEEYEGRGFTIREVASGFRIQIESDMVARLQKLWEQRPPRYSRAMFETLALIAYRQPMTRGEIEEIRGVSVSSNIIRSLLEREWVRIVGHRDVPGRPEMFGTTKQFLDYFGLKKLDDLPPLADLTDWESLRVQLNLPAVEGDEAGIVDDNDTAPDPAAMTDIPAVHGEDEPGPEADPHESVPGIDAAPFADADVEPIEAIEWPSPEEGDTVVHVLDPDAVNDEADTEEDADASLTGA